MFRFQVAALLLALFTLAAAQHAAEDVISPPSDPVTRSGCTTGYCGHGQYCCSGYYCGSDYYCKSSCDHRPCGNCCYGYYCRYGRCVKH